MCRLVDGEAAVLASKRSKEKEKEREKEREKEKEKEREKERLKDNPLYSHMKGKESRRFKNEMQQSDTGHTASSHPLSTSLSLSLSLSVDNDVDTDAAAAAKSSEEIEFAVDSVVVDDGTTIVIHM